MLQTKVTVNIRLKEGVLDPQGKAIEGALGHLGFGNVASVRQGKLIELILNEADVQAARQQAEEMARKLLANTVMEVFTIDVTPYEAASNAA